MIRQRATGVLGGSRILAWIAATILGPACAFEFVLSFSVPQVAHSVIWRQMPLRTEAMKTAGYSGGDGYQCGYGFRFAPSNPDYVYLAIDCAQIWRSTDGGYNWHRASKGFRANGGMDLAVDPANEKVVFVAGCQGAYASPEVNGVYRTLDGGDSWEKVLSAGYYKLDGPRGNSLIWIDPASESNGVCRTVYAVDQDGAGIFRSDNGGTTWTNIGVAGPGLIYDFQKNPFADEFWVSTESGAVVVTLVDGGYLQRDLSATGLPSGNDKLISRIQFHPANSNVIYAACGTAGFYKSTDGGVSFAASNQGIPEYLIGTEAIEMLDMNPLNPDWLIMNYHKVYPGGYVSTNGGQSWTLFPGSMDAEGMVSGLYHSIETNRLNYFYVGHKAAFHPTDPDTALIQGKHWWIERTDDGGQSWRWSGNGFAGIRAGVGRTSFSFPMSRRAEMTLFCTDAGAFRSDDSGASFRSLEQDLVTKTTAVGAVHPEDSNTVICAAGTWSEQQLVMTSDGGQTWEMVCDEIRNFKYCSYHPQNSSVIYANDLRSDDGGETWTQLLYKVADVFPRNGDVVYGFTGGGGQTRVYRSVNRGDDWTQVGDALVTTGTFEMAVDPNDMDRIYVPAANGLNIWNGQQWRVRCETNGLPKDWYGKYNLRNITVAPNDSRVLYMARNCSAVGYTDGILKSEDRGMTWTNITANLGPEMTVWALGIDSRHDRLYAGTSQGTWYTSADAGMVLAGWDGSVTDTSSVYSNMAAVAAEGIHAVVFLGSSEAWQEAGTGSDDHSFGVLPGARESAGTVTGCFLSKTNAAHLTFQITNNSDSEYSIDSFQFDAWRGWAGNASNYTVSVLSGDMTAGEVASGVLTVQWGNPQDQTSPDFEDVSVSFSELSDHSLLPGETVLLRLSIADPRNSFGVYIDNVAVAGSRVEPATVPLAVWDCTVDTAGEAGRSADAVAHRILATVFWDETPPWTDVGAGSDDLTCGTIVQAVESTNTASGAFLSSTNNAVMDFLIINHSELSYELENFCFDAWRGWAGNASRYSVGSIAGGVTYAADFADGTLCIQGANPQSVSHPDYEDIDVPLSALSDRTLSPGEWVVLRLKIYDERPSAQNVYVDNVAVAGRAVSEIFQ